jgi:hypothetical protein
VRNEAGGTKFGSVHEQPPRMTGVMPIDWLSGEIGRRDSVGDRFRRGPAVWRLSFAWPDQR